MFLREDLEGLFKKIGFSDRIIFEKAVFAFELLKRLIKIYPGLIFRGGTSLLLYQFPPHRFSIDIDIILEPTEQEKLYSGLRKVISEKGFIDIVEDKRENKLPIPKRHFKFYYHSYYSKIKQYILLDIVFSKVPYKKLIEKELKDCPLSFNSSLKVLIPTAEALFADKLCALSFNTIGIPLRKEMELVKQIVDLGFLFNFVEKIKQIKENFKSIVELESSFRQKKFSTAEVIEDILNICFHYCQYLVKGGNNSYKEILHINNGLKRITNHLVEKYNYRDLKLILSKIAYISSLLESQRIEPILKSIDYNLIKGKELIKRFSLLERLKEENPQSYFYWVMAFSK